MYSRIYDYGGISSAVFIDEEGDGMESDCSPCSPTHLVFARTHAELAGRKDRPVNEGLSLREKLDTDDYWNWE